MTKDEYLLIEKQIQEIMELVNSNMSKEYIAGIYNELEEEGKQVVDINGLMSEAVKNSTHIYNTLDRILVFAYECSRTKEELQEIKNKINKER